MRTAVQLRESLPRAELVVGAPESMHAGARGPVARFAPGALVGYLVESSSRTRLFLFRTLVAADPLAALVPGVAPGVRLLWQLRTAERIDRARRLLDDLARERPAVSELPDAFFLRASVLLAGRAPAPARLLSLLDHGASPC